MKVYIVGHEDYDGTDILGIYSTRTKAVAAFDDLASELSEEINVFEMEVDPVIQPEDKYRLCYYCNAKTDGSVQHGTRKEKPGLLERLCKWHTGKGSDGTFAYCGFGKTAAEAEARAKAGLATFQPVWQVGRASNAPDQLVEVQHPHPSCLYDWKITFAVHEDLNTARQMLLA